MKLVFFLTFCCISSITFAECQSASYHYALSGKADGDMIKTISCEEDNHMMTINAKTDVSKLGHHVTVEQTVMGSYVSDQFTPTLSTVKDSREHDGQPVDVQLSNGEYDTLSLVYALEQDLSKGNAISTHINVLQNGQIQAFQVTQELGVKLDTRMGTLETIKITLSAQNDCLIYWFAMLEEGHYVMVQSDIAHNGKQVFLATLQA